MNEPKKDKSQRQIKLLQVLAEGCRKHPEACHDERDRHPALLAGTARRRDRDGIRFLSREMVRAGERLREDFEMAQMGAKQTTDWVGFLETLHPASAPKPANTLPGAQLASARVVAALQDLGPGLSDVVLRCCCFLEGLETAEKALGWSARSGKIVLRIALMRLEEYYAQDSSAGAAMIG
mgnify:CR=1 FL=1